MNVTKIECVLCCILCVLPQVRAFVDMAYKRTVEMVEKHRDKIEAMTQALLVKEVGGWGRRGIKWQGLAGLVHVG